MALERKETAKSALRDMVFKVYELNQAIESSGSTEEARKAHSDAQKMVEIFDAELKRREAEIIALDDEEKALDDSIEALKNLC